MHSRAVPPLQAKHAESQLAQVESVESEKVPVGQALAARQLAPCW